MNYTRLVIVAGIAACVFGAGLTEPVQASQPRVIGMPLDWSEQSVVFAHPATAQEAAAKGNSARWNRLAGDPRYVLALARRFEAEASRHAGQRAKSPGRTTPAPAPQSGYGMQRDWSHVLGGLTGGKGDTGIYPAKYSFDIAATPSCANDFVVYSTGTAGASSSGTASWRDAKMVGQDPVGTLILGTAGTARSVTLIAANNNTGFNFDVAGDDIAEAASLAAAINRWSHQTGIVGSSAGDTVRATNAANSNAPVVLTNNLTNVNANASAIGTGTVGQPTIIAYNQLYNTTCNAGRSNTNAPNTYWAYNTGTGRIAETSPVISYYDGGKQVAFIQRNPAPAPDQLELVLLKWATGPGNGSAANPTTPTAVTPANYKACTAPCMTVIPLSGTSNTDNAKTYSAPFVDYGADVLWVGDGNSTLHKFTGVFRGTATPTEAAAGGFPAVLSATPGLKVSSPVYDFAGNVFVGGGAGGRLYRVSAVNGTVTESAQLTAPTYLSGLRAGPVVDTAAQRVYAFLFNDGSTACNGGSCEAVVQFPTSFASASAGTKVTVGSGQGVVNAVMHRGRFDSAYYASPANARTGALYVCGTTNLSRFDARLWKIPIVNGVMQAPQMGAQLGPNVAGSCSPVTVLKNGANEYLYASVPDGSVSAGCTGACLFMFNLSNLNGIGAPWGAANLPTATLPVFGGTTGIIMDNISSTPGTSQIYFSHLETPGNAVQASQSALN